MQIIKNNRQLVCDISSEQREVLKEHLTYNNPAYASAKRYGRSKYISIPPYLTYYTEKSVKLAGSEERKKIIEVPIGVDVEKILDTKASEIIDNRSENKVRFPKFELELRNDQAVAEEHYLSSVQDKTYPSCIIQLPTGKGKSILALHLAYVLQQKTLILVHKDDLVVGWQKDIKLCFPTMKSGLIKAKKREVGEQITIATIQTLSRMDEDTLSQYLNQFGFVVQDECLVENTLVCLEDGGVKTIDHITNFDRVIGGRVSNKFSRKSKIYELHSNHAIIKGSPTHPTWCVKRNKKSYTVNDFECKPIKDITSDYYIPILTTIPHITKNDLSVEEARFVAMIMCDGHLDKTSRIVKVNVNKDRKYYYDVMKSFADKIGAELKYSHDTRENITYWFTDDKVKYILTTKWGVQTGKKSNILTIPSALYYCPLDSIKAFVETCFNCEGDISVSKTGSVRVNFNTVSENFAQGLSMLLKKFGIVSNIQKIERSGNHNTVYRLSVGGVFYNKFAETFNLIDRKTSNLRNPKTQNIRFVGDYYLSPVKCVKDLGFEEYVYDFTVSGKEHSFIANGVYTHNCHHLNSNWFSIIDRFSAKYKLGLSATPKRSDNCNYLFDLYFGGLCYKHIITEDDEDICNVEVEVLESKFKYRPFLYDGMIFNAFDYKPSELPENPVYLESMDYKDRPIVPYLTIDAEATLSRHTKIMVCKKIIEHYRQGHSIIALFTQKEHIEAYARYLGHYIPKDQIMLYYGDSKEKSEVMMKKAEDREVLVTLATYAKATEGTNVKSWEVEFLVSSLNNAKNVEQATGRIRRRKEGKLNPVKVYDIRYTDSYTISNHFNTRLQVYKKLKYIVKGVTPRPKNSIFSRGYNLTRK